MSKVLVPLVLLISSLGLVFSYVKPTWENLQAYKALEERLITAKADFEAFQTKKSDLAQQYSQIKQADLRRIERMVPDRIDVVQTIIDLDTLASANNVFIDTFVLPGSEMGAGVTPSNEDGRTAHTGSEFSISASGSYQGFKSFLAGLEASLVLMDVTLLGVDASGEEDLPFGQYSYQLSFTTYALR